MTSILKYSELTDELKNAVIRGLNALPHDTDYLKIILNKINPKINATSDPSMDTYYGHIHLDDYKKFLKALLKYAN
jgi:hypothetical protein